MIEYILAGALILAIVLLVTAYYQLQSSIDKTRDSLTDTVNNLKKAIKEWRDPDK